MLKFKPFKVSFYLIVSLALRVNSHSLQERIALGMITTSKKEIYIMYSLGQLERRQTQYQTKTKLKFNSLCYFKKQNWEMHCLLTAFYDL